ncbi:21691_t:CDS:2, partial [Racocetra persica]
SPYELPGGPAEVIAKLIKTIKGILHSYKRLFSKDRTSAKADKASMSVEKKDSSKKIET